MVIDALILDFDGVIVESESMHLAAVSSVVAPYGVTLTESDWIERCVGHHVDHVLEQLLAERTTAQERQELAQKKGAVFLEMLSQADLRCRPGIPELIEAARRMHLPVAVASASSEEEITTALRRLGLSDAVDVVVGSESVDRPKPRPDAYLRALELVGARASHTVVLEDTPTGIAAAKAAGVYCVAYPHRFTQGRDLSAADLVMEQLDGRAIQRLLSSPWGPRVPTPSTGTAQSPSEGFGP